MEGILRLIRSYPSSFLETTRNAVSKETIASPIACDSHSGNCLQTMTRLTGNLSCSPGNRGRLYRLPACLQLFSRKTMNCAKPCRQPTTQKREERTVDSRPPSRPFAETHKAIDGRAVWSPQHATGGLPSGTVLETEQGAGSAAA
jgi:hypothetical protein